MITAKEARENVMTYCNDHIDYILAKLSEEIEEASKRGASGIRVFEYDEEILKMIVKACRRNGYKVTNLYGVVTVSWK